MKEEVAGDPLNSFYVLIFLITCHFLSIKVFEDSRVQGVKGSSEMITRISFFVLMI